MKKFVLGEIIEIRPIEIKERSAMTLSVRSLKEEYEYAKYAYETTKIYQPYIPRYIEELELKMKSILDKIIEESIATKKSTVVDIEIVIPESAYDEYDEKPEEVKTFHLGEQWIKEWGTQR